MLPTPEIRRLVEQQPLDRRTCGAATRRTNSVVVELRVERVAGDVRDLGRQLGAARRRPTGRRTSAGRRSAARSPGLGAAAAEREPDPQVALVGRAGRLDEQLAAHAEVAEQGVAVVERRARGTCRGGGRPRSGGRSARRRSRPGRGGRGAPAAGGAPRPTRWCGRRRGARGRRGRSRPRAARARCRSSAGRSTGAGGDRLGTGGRSGRRARRTPSRRRPARPPSWSGRRRCRSGWSPTRTCAVKVFMWSGPSSSMRYSGTPRPCSAESSWRRGLPVEAGAHAPTAASISGSKSRWTTWRGALEAAGEVDRADHRLDGVGQDRGLLAAAGGLLAAAELDVARRARSCGRRRPARGR